LARWQPLRLGLVELYYYDVEEFWFRDGHLMLRGNNGTGKSKVLSLTLPFLLDANLVSSRVEPDGDRNKRMEWNLLMGRHERRTGYTWVEFGRLDEEGTVHTLTLGCGLRAVAGRSGVDSWYFITDQRIGADLWLTSPQRTALTRDRLAEALGTRGHIFPTAHEYKRAVDERLFGLGEIRYATLVNTLIQLRQPQLSKQPDENRLSDALTDSLSPLDRDSLQDVADAMGQLEDLARELQELQAMRKAISSFEERYRRYAQVASRRHARVLRQAQTAFDDVSRDLNAAEQTLDRARIEVDHWRTTAKTFDEELAADSGRISALETHPTMQDARRIADARLRATDYRNTLSEVERRLATARSRLSEEADNLAARHTGLQSSRADLVRVTDELSTLARECGIEVDHARALGRWPIPDGIAEAGSDIVEVVRREIRDIDGRRREQIRHIRKLLRDLKDANDALSLARSERSLREQALDSAQQASELAARTLRETGTTLIRAWRDYVDRLELLNIPDREGPLAELELWVESASGPNPLASELQRAWQTHESQVAGRSAAIEAQRQQLLAERQALHSEAQRLESGEIRLPPASHTRLAETRVDRPGAPLWQLVDFSPDLSAQMQPGLEAALEASGLLDAWLLPEGVLIDPMTQDTLLVQRSQQPHSLASWLVPDIPAAGPGAAVGGETIISVLRSIACSEQDPSSSEVWLSPRGQFRMGPAQGAWSKPQAQYIGHTAREATRRARLAEIATRDAEIDETLQDCARSLASERVLRERAGAELANAPSDESLSRAHSAREITERARREAQARFGEADSKYAFAESACSLVRDTLARDAESLRLPREPDAIDSLEQQLDAYRSEATDLINALREHQRSLTEFAKQQRRTALAQEDVEKETRDESEKRRLCREAEEIALALQQSVGKAVEELLSELGQARRLKEEHTKAHKDAQAHLIVASGNRGTAETKLQGLKQSQDERTQSRKQAVTTLQAFAITTGLLSVAVPDLALPDTSAPWGIEAALVAARRAEQALADVPSEDTDWSRVQGAISTDLKDLQTALSTQGHSANAEISDFGMSVHVVYGQRSERPDVLSRLLTADIEDRRLTLSVKERQVLEQHLEKEIAANLQRMMSETEERVKSINAELDKRPTSTGVRYRLDWQPLAEDAAGGVIGLQEARKRLLRTNPDAWSAQDRHQLGEFLRSRIEAERSRDDQATLLESLAGALDYRRWHRFRVQRLQDRQWKPLSGPASSGERALGLTVPLFAAASSHYEGASPFAPRLVLLDEAFAGIDDEARANCMALIREFDLDFVMTSEREWGCYSQLPGLAICQLTRREGMDAVLVTRWSWDGRERRAQQYEAHRYPDEKGAIDQESRPGLNEVTTAESPDLFS
jgi:uncharacterized protein (TIGR02680 family)